VNFQLSEDQEALRTGTRKFCDEQMPVTRLAELEKTQGFDRELWGELAQMGVFSLHLAEETGGAGLGMAEAVLVFCELGRRLVPGPLAWSQLAAGHIDGAAEGECVVGGIDRVGAPTGPILIEHLESLDALMVLRPDGVYRVDPGQLRGQPVEVPLDPLTPLHYLDDLLEGDRIGGADEMRQLRLQGAALSTALMLGIAESTLELANAYAKEREQFGRAIGSFQAVKHMLADMFVRMEVARAAVYAAGATLDDPVVGSIPRAVAAAVVTAGEAAHENSCACIQIHGGMGYTWEVPAHYYMKRSWVLGTQFGDREEYCETLSEIIEQSL
jgi:alkylation response protein AidB-like acyl-CoA dehydrogenase